eukprot:scaffold4490_cov257-Ochromonas_danica.AAC.1
MSFHLGAVKKSLPSREVVVSMNTAPENKLTRDSRWSSKKVPSCVFSMKPSFRYLKTPLPSTTIINRLPPGRLSLNEWSKLFLLYPLNFTRGKSVESTLTRVSCTSAGIRTARTADRQMERFPWSIRLFAHPEKIYRRVEALARGPQSSYGRDPCIKRRERANREILWVSL